MEADENGIVSYSITIDEEDEIELLVDSIYGNENAGDEMPTVIEIVPSTSSIGNLSPKVGLVLDEEEAKRINELTSLYLTGKLSFSQYLRGTGAETEKEDSEEPTNSDSDYEPDFGDDYESPKKRIAKNKFCEEFDKISNKRKFARKKIKQERRILPPVLSNLLGEANLKYAKDEKEIAAEICEEIIRQVPQDPGAYKLLALIYKDQANNALAHHYALIAAHLSPDNTCDDWIQLAETSLEFGEKEQAMTCLRQAIKSDKYNPDPRLREIKLLQNMGETKLAQRARERMVETLSSSEQMTHLHGRLILLQAKIVAREFHQENNLQRATKIMEIAINACKQHAVQDDIHILVELHCEQNENFKGLVILQNQCGVVLEPADPPYEMCYCPPEIAFDLRAKLIVFLVRLDISPKLLVELISPFLEIDPNEQGDLFLDIVDALMAKNRFEEAMILLKPLTDSESFGFAAVWLSQAECQRHLNLIEESIESYNEVIKLAPQHVQARLTLSSMLYNLDKFDAALDVLQSKDTEPRLLYEEFHLLLQLPDKYTECVNVAIKLFHVFLGRKNLKYLYNSYLQRRKLKFPDNVPNTDNTLSAENLTEILIKASDVCIKHKLYEKFQELTFICLFIRRLITSHKSIIEFACCIASTLAGDAEFAFLLLRPFILQFPQSVHLWTLFSLLSKYVLEEHKQTRFVLRRIHKSPSNLPAGICYANHCFIAGSYKDALVEYGSRHNIKPSPFLALMIAICHIHLALFKRPTNRHASVVEAKAYLDEYVRLRGTKCEQEIYYNLGRAMHSLHLHELAVGYYKKALECPPPPQLKSLDLSKEVACNLAQIYKNSGNMYLAQKLIRQHIVIE